MANVVHRTLLYIIHAFLNIYIFMFNIFWLISSSAQSLLGKINAESIDFKNDSKSLNKIPIHIGIILTDDSFTTSDVSSILVWCVGIGISYITIYDPSGVVKRRKDKLQVEIKERKDQYKQLQDFYIQICTSTDIRKSSAPSKHKDVVVLSSEDCRSGIVNKARQMASLIKEQQLKYADINTTSVDEALQEQWSFPDPDLLLTCGKVESLLGYLPWQTRLSEILVLPTIRNISYRTFLSKLEQYAHSKQRFGR